MFGPHLVALALPLLASGARTDVGAAATIQAGGGLRPIEFDAREVPVADGRLSLPVGLRVQSPRTTFRLIYAPQFQLQFPNAASTYRPLLMHQLRSDYLSRISRRTQLRAEVTGAVGETSYNAVQEYFEPGTSDVRTRLARFAQARAAVGTGTQTSPRNTLGWSLGSGIQGPVDVGASRAEPSSLPTTYDTTLTVRDGYFLSIVNQLTFSSRVGYVGVIGSPVASRQDLGQLGADVAWRHLLSPRSEMTLTGGGTVVYGMESEAYSFAPTATASHSVGFRGAGANWTTTSSLGVAGFLDRVSATYRTQAFGGVTTTGRFGRSWIVSMRGAGTTSLTRHPIEPPTYESRASANQTTTYLISSRGEVNWGVSASIRAPHATALDSLVAQRELTAFVGFRWNVGTDRENGRWVR